MLVNAKAISDAYAYATGTDLISDEVAVRHLAKRPETVAAILASSSVRCTATKLMVLADTALTC